MADTPPAEGHSSLSATLKDLVDSLDGKDTTVGGLLEAIGERGFGLLFMILALPAALPIPAAGYGTPFGIMLMIGGAQLAMRRKTPWLPKWAMERTITNRFLQFVLRNAGFPLRVAEFLIRPRLGGLARSPVVESLIGVIIVILAAFMTLPIPLTNTAPSFVIFVLACGLVEEDGLVLLGGLLLAPVAVGIAGLSLYFATTLGVEYAEEAVKGLLRGGAEG